MPKSYAEQLNKKKKDEEKIVGQQQKTQPAANKPIGSTSIPKSRTQSSAASSSRAKNLDTSGRSTSAKDQARKDRAKKYVERNPSARNYTNDTRSRRTELRTTKQRNEDERKEKRLNLPGYSAGQYGKNSNWTPTRQKMAEVAQSNTRNNINNYSLGNGQTIGGGTISRIPDASNLPMIGGVNQINDLDKYKINGQFDLNAETIGNEENNTLPYVHYEPIARNGIKWDRDDGTGELTISGKEFVGSDNKRLTKEDIRKGVDNLTPEIMQEWLSPEYKLDKDAREIAKLYAQQELSKYTSGVGGVPQIGTPEEREDYANLRSLANKTSPLASFAQGFIDPYAKVGRLARDVVSAPFASEEDKEWNRKSDELWEMANQNAQKQNPNLNAAGELAGNATEYALTEPVVNAVAGLIGVTSKFGKFVVNQAVNLMQDGVLDIGPLINDLSKRNDLTEEQKVAQIANAIRNDALGNVFGYGLSNAVGKLGKTASESAIEAAEQTAKNAVPEITQQASKDFTNPFGDLADEIINPGVADNVAPEIDGLGSYVARNAPQAPQNTIKNNGFLNILRDNEYAKLADMGADKGLLNDSLGKIVQAVDSADRNAYDAAITEFKQLADAEGINFDRVITRLNRYIDGNVSEDLDTELINSITHNIDTIDAELKKLDAIGVPPTKNGTDWLANAHKALDDYESAVFDNGDVTEATETLNKALGNLNNQAKKLDAYDGAFSAWKGGGTPRGDLYSNSSRIPGYGRTDWTDDMIEELNEYSNQNRFARPANQISENVDDAIPGKEALPEANTNVPKVETGNSDNPKLDRGPEERLVDTNDVKERGYARSTRNNADVPDELAADFVDKPELYNVLHNSTTREKSNAVLAQGFDKAYNDFKDMLNKKDPAAIPVGYDLAKQMIDNGDTDGASELIRDMARELTKAGQFSQAAAMTIMRGDPMTALRYAEKEIDSLNTAGLERFGKKWKDFELTPDEVEAFKNIDAGDEDAIKALYDRIGERIGKEYPTSTLEKLLEARRIGMLFNPRTNVRNLAANVPTLALRWTSDRLDAVGQNITHLINPEFEVTQSIRGSGKKGRELAKQVFESDKVKALLEGTSGKYKDASITGSILKEKQMYKGTAFDKWVNRVTHNGLQRLNEKAFGKKGVESIPETLRNATYKALDLGDSPFVKENFIERLGSYIRAQKYTSIDEIPDEAIETAWEAAMKATYKDESWAYKLIRDVKGALTNNGGKVGKTVGESLIPFVQAPGNIAARMIDYSPVGGINGIKTIIKGVKDGSEKAVREGINELAQGATGTLALGIGIALYNSGIISGAYSSDKDKRAYEKSHGYREYALHIGDGYYTLDWAQPAFQTIMNGVILADAIKKSDEYDSEILKYFGKEGSTAGKIIGATKKGVSTSINSWFNASPLQSMQDLLGGTYEDANDIASKLWEVGVEDFVGSYIPSSVNALAKTVDTTQRQTTDPSNKVASFVNQQVAKVPYASKNLPAKYDTWGREMKYADSKRKAFFNRFVNPGEGTKENKEAIDHELDRIFDVTDDNAIYPQEAPKKVDGNPLTARQFSELQKNMGERSYDMANTLLKLEGYKEFNDEEKAKEYANIYSVAKWAAQLEQFEPDMYNFLKKGDETVWNDLSDSNKADHKAYLLGGAEGYLDHRIYSHELSTRNISASEKTDEIWNSDLSLKEKKTQLDDYANYKSILKENDATDSEEARDIYYLEGEDALKEYLNKKKVFKDIGAPNTDNAEALYSEGRIEELEEYTKYYNAAKDEDTLTVTNKGVVESLSEASPEDQKKYTEMLISSPAKGAEDAAKHYENGMYQYYKYKMDADLNGDGKTTNEEITDFLKDVKNLPEADKAYWDKTLRGAKTSIFDGTAKTKKKSSEKASQTGSTNVNKKVSLNQNSTTNSIPDLGWSVSNGKKTFDLHDAKGYKKATKAGISDDEWLNAYWAANTNKDHHITAAEAKAYISALGNISQTEKHDWFDYLIGTKAKNPY